MFSRTLVERLEQFSEHPWCCLKTGKELTEKWFAERLREYEVRPHCFRIGETVAKGYLLDEFQQALMHGTNLELWCLRI